MFEYNTRGTCSSKIFFDISDDKVKSIQFEGGCNGNLKAISKLCEGMEPAELVKMLKGIKCGYKDTSCGDQLANAVEQAIAHNAKESAK